MKLTEAYPSSFLKADDLNGEQVRLTIKKVTLEEIGQGKDKESKLIVAFEGQNKKLVLNKTNAKTISKLHGDDTDDWEGKDIFLAAREVEFQGDMVWSIRVSLQDPAKVAKTAKPAVAASSENAPF